MNCWHCCNELELISPAGDEHKFYHCVSCDKWYEMFKEKEKRNGAVPVRFLELETSPSILTSLYNIQL